MWRLIPFVPLPLLLLLLGGCSRQRTGSDHRHRARKRDQTGQPTGAADHDDPNDDVTG
jgi:hypothetical protein